MNKRILFLSLVLCLVLFVIGCDDDPSYYVDVQTSKWYPVYGSDSCWKCHTAWNETNDGKFCQMQTVNGKEFPSNDCGLLPPEFIHDGYECTETMCDSLGKDCKFIPDSENGPMCIFNKSEPVKLVVKDFKSESICNSGNCVEEKIDDGVSMKLIINGELKPATDVNLSFITYDVFRNIKYPSVCYFSNNSLAKIEEMTRQEYFENPNLYSSTHKFSIPSPISKVNMNQKHIYYITCIPTGGGEPVKPFFVFEFTIAAIPDKFAPAIKRIEPEQGLFKANQTNPEVKIIVDDDNDVICKWSDKRPDILFKDMDEMKGLICNKYSGSMERKCTGRIENVSEIMKSFYFRCSDSLGNVDEENPAREYIASYSLPLVINSVKCPPHEGDECSGDISDEKINMTVYVSGGVDNGKASCAFNVGYGFTNFNETNRSDGQSIQPGIKLVKGDNKIFIDCVDSIGNTAKFNTTLNYQKDETKPKIIKIYSDNSLVYLVLSEKADCRYSGNSIFVFDNATVIDSADGITYPFAYGDNSNFIVECRDRSQNSGGKHIINVVKKA